MDASPSMAKGLSGSPSRAGRVVADSSPGKARSRAMISSTRATLSWNVTGVVVLARSRSSASSRWERTSKSTRA